ncbi:MAG TPA: protein kinase [Actinomycetota bacterium]|nr:protein kinase [Actinomycetota bacterium]
MTIEGTVVADRYAVGQLLGRGGMAEVYLATDRVLDRPVAFKVLGGWLANDATFVERFRREALAAARISHPNLVAVFDTGSEGGVQYIVMEHVAGETLADTLRREGRILSPRATRIATDLADALAVAHAARMVHRDVKPANVMLTPDGRTKLMDLGIARSLDGESITHASSILGTAGYVSPEQARGDPVDHRSDIYSLGCVLYEMLSGHQPFEAADPLAMAYKHVHETPAPPTSLEPSIPPALEAVTLRAMEKNPAARFQSVAEMASALDDRTVPVAPIAATAPQPAVGATTPLPVVAATDTLPRRADRLPRRRRMLPLVLGLAGLALLGGLAFALLGGDEPGRSGSVTSPSPSRSPSRSESPSPSASPPESPSPSPIVAPDPVEEAATALMAVVAEGVETETISSKAAEDIQKRIDEALAKYSEGDTEKAIRTLDDLESKVDDLVDQDEVAQSQEQKLDKAIRDLAEAMFLADPAEEDDEDD